MPGGWPISCLTTGMSPGTFLDPIALAIVCGGTLLATMLRTPRGDLLRAVMALRVILRRPFDAAELLEQIAAQARIARRHGVMALDRSMIRDPDVAAAIAAVVDGADDAAVETLLGACQRARTERHCPVIDCWSGMVEAAPAMGMVGTLVGLVAMFAQMTDPAAIGGAMAVALLATLYGALLSNLVAAPIAARLRSAARIEAIERERLVAPLAALAAREAPRVVVTTMPRERNAA